MSRACTTCGMRYPIEDLEPCKRCNRIEAGYVRDAGYDGDDAAYALHELAHFILLFRRLPRGKRDWESVTPAIEQLTPGRSQFHEMRALALGYAGEKALGWRTSLERSVRESWLNVRDAYGSRKVRDSWESLVRSRTHMLKIVKGLVREVSPRNLKMFTNKIQAWLR